ncbi:MAG: hypothetical protein OEQ39_25070, partial [Gammaproteobacteria bacterium]|nr:hypothetical protein [Gammaproteobacteria bacterium]
EDFLHFEGTTSGLSGSSVVASVPAIIYKGDFDTNSSGDELLTDSEITEDEIRDTALTRYLSTGYSVKDEVTGDETNTFSFILQEEITITFNWQVEHAVIVDSAVIDTKGNGGLGLEDTAIALGNPFPEVKKHWILEDELFTAFIDGIAADAIDFGTRYIVTGYDAEGTAKSTPAVGLGLPLPHKSRWTSAR